MQTAPMQTAPMQTAPMQTIGKTIANRLKMSTTLGVLALFSASAPLSANAQQAAPQKAAVAKPAVPATEEEEGVAPAAKKPNDEGIKVHGHWIMDVKDKNGKIVEHRDFQNALTFSGATVLTQLLTGLVVPASFNILAVGDSQSYSMYQSTGSNPLSACTSGGGTTCSGTLVASSNGTSITLQASFVAQASVNINTVFTGLSNCYSTNGSATVPARISPAACNSTFVPSGNDSFGTFGLTSKALASPLAVAAGQTLAITVTLSFS